MKKVTNEMEKCNVGRFYVGTDETTFRNTANEAMREAQGDFLFKLATCKRYEYRCELGYDDDDNPHGVIYYFPHYCIYSPNNRIQVDSDEVVDITHITSYNEFNTVLIRPEDMNVKGFTDFIYDRLINNIIYINELKIKASADPENYNCYRELRTIVDFINKYIKELNWMTPSGRIVLIHTIDEDYRHYGVVKCFDDLSELEYSKHEYILPFAEDTKPQKQKEDKTIDELEKIANLYNPNNSNYGIVFNDVDFASTRALGDEIKKYFGTSQYNMKVTRLENFPDNVDDSASYPYVIKMHFGDIDSTIGINRYNSFVNKVRCEYSKLWEILKTHFELEQTFDSYEAGAHFRIEVRINGKNPDIILKDMKKNGCDIAKRVSGKLSCYVFDMVISGSDNYLVTPLFKRV